MKKIATFYLLLLFGFKADAVCITHSTIRLEQIITSEGRPTITDKDIDLFLEDGQGLSVKKIVLGNEQFKKKHGYIDFTSRSLGDTIIDKSLYLVPLGLTCIVNDIINSQIEEPSSKVIGLFMWAVISAACHKYAFSRIESLSSLDQKISKIFPNNPSLMIDRKDSFRSFIYFILNGVHSLGSLLFVNHLWFPNILVKTFAGMILSIRTIGVLRVYSFFEKEDLNYMPLVTLGELVDSPLFANATKTAE